MRSLDFTLFYSSLTGIKRISFFAAGMLLTGLLTISCTREMENVPSAVQLAFATRFPGVTPKWENQPFGYEGVFTQNGIEYEAEFSSTGEWLETEYELSAAAFPQRVLDRVQQDYPGFSITKYEIEITPLGTFYELEIQKGNEEWEIYYDSQANPRPNTNEDA